MESKIILGTVQLGVDYGINNKNGKPEENDAIEILKNAANKGINTVDTSDYYGNSNQLIAKYNKTTNKPFNIITKISLGEEISGTELIKFILRKIEKLNTTHILCLMFHSYENYNKNFNDYISEYEKLKEMNLIKKIGVSVYSNQQALSVLHNNNVDIIQIPFNLFDNFNKRGEIIDLAHNKGVEIHVRSIFLQGLFFVDLNYLHPKLEPLKKYLIKIHDIANQHEISVNSLAINYAYAQNNIKKILMGVDSVNQLIKNTDSINNKFDKKILNEVNTIDIQEIELLDPLFWIKKKIINLHKTS